MKRLWPLLLIPLVVAALFARPSAVIPSEPWGAVETTQPRTGAPQYLTPTSTATGRVEASASAAVGGAPHPSGGIGNPATFWKPGYKPRPTPRVVVSKGTGLSGQATWWFSFGHGLYAALRPDLGTKGDLAIVCGGTPYHCLSLPVITSCLCLGRGSDRLIDLSRDAFESFADPSVGTVRIVLQVVKGGAP